MQAIVEGYIEVVRVTNGLAMICNENGKLVSLPYNPTATRIYHKMGGNKWDCIVGSTLVGTWEELGFVDEEEEEEEENNR